MVRQPQRVRFADRKTPIVSSHRKLALSVARQLGLQKEAVQTQTVGLGVDVSAGKTRSVTSARRKKRIQKVRQEKSQTANADEASGVAGAKNLQMWPAPSCRCTGMKSQTSLMWSGDPCSAWPRRRTVRSRQADPFLRCGCGTKTRRRPQL